MPLDPSWRPALVALDLDGTVVAPDESISPRVRAAVAAVRAAGVPLVLSTGRSVLGTRPVAAELGLADGWLVCSNGTVIATLDPPVVTDTVTFDARPALEVLRREVPGALVAVEELGVGYHVSAPFPPGELTGEQVVLDIDALVEEPVTRVVLRSPEHESEHFLEIIARLGLQDVSYAVGYDAWLDLTPVGVSKATALATVCERLGVAQTGVLAVGDGRNDLEMLQWAGVGVAMGHAPAEVQDAADLVTEDFEADGCAAALERWFA
ncbi:HAD superfamily hydrolase (TIGR01484 family) [Motilibacter peucedani]|uniref:HAD superfamily hydrolase (TIGR01484 family) n=1 Tax=Motilibacter peucedani TaxID=598650 RepID=A0A420XTX3_9ACTN|nr:HAD family hydrolase [Motilibacter peucedani]RKS80278.1 HAD superfamily hydrolase (TIGR01484 family) [Motilibacter peucedani]